MRNFFSSFRVIKEDKKPMISILVKKKLHAEFKAHFENKILK